MQGSNLTKTHQIKSALRPRTRVPVGVSDESLDDAILRYQQAKADTESLDAEKRGLDVAKMRRELIPADEMRDSLEAIHLLYVAELEQLPHAVIASLPSDVPSSLCDKLRGLIEAECLKLRNKIGNS